MNSDIRPRMPLGTANLARIMTMPSASATISTRQVYEYLRTRSDFRALLFFSDHGEDPKHGHTLDPFTWKMVRIPLWAAFSDGFIQSAPEAVQALKENVGKFFTNDMVFDLVCGHFRKISNCG